MTPERLSLLETKYQGETAPANAEGKTKNQVVQLYEARADCRELLMYIALLKGQSVSNS